MIIYKCDICKQKINKDQISHLEHTFSYGHLRDGETWHIDLCENCLEKIIEENNL